MFDLGIQLPPKDIQSNRKTIKYENSSTLEKLTLGDLIKFSESYPQALSYIPSKNENLKAFNELRNIVSHQRFLLPSKLKPCIVDETKKKDLLSNLYNVKQILPIEFQKGFVTEINSCIKDLHILERDIIVLK
ncbi:MAG: hypothetical protein LBE57_01870 [Methanosarcinales archaeon]|jgi:hypothetical protein|nr:hypothetical protein [Methanosarcinales archaeon]